jgi:nucleoside-diphosphate-sugar epimerase
MTRRILVIGGTGLIGGAIVRQLVDGGNDVTACSRDRSGGSLPQSVARLVVDRRDFPAFESLMVENGTWDAVVDTACYLPEEAEGAVRAFAGRTAQYILTSTVDVYRRPASRYPYVEDEPLEGISDYARNKVACEGIVLAAHRAGRLPVKIVRPAATYGDGSLPVHSLGRSTTYLDRLKRGKPIVSHGDGSSLWVFCHAEDVARAFVGAIGNDRALGRAYHAAGEEWLTWDQHHALLAEVIGAPPPRLVHIPSDALAILAPERSRLAVENLQFPAIFDNSLARAELGFRYTILMREGLAGWYRSLADAGRIEDSDGDPLDDQLIEAWGRVTAGGAFTGSVETPKPPPSRPARGRRHRSRGPSVQRCGHTK